MLHHFVTGEALSEEVGRTSMIVFSHLVLLPGPEEVDRAVLSLLDDRPASLSLTLFTPRLHEPVGSLRTQQVDPTAVLTRVQDMLAVTPRP